MSEEHEEHEHDEDCAHVAVPLAEAARMGLLGHLMQRVTDQTETDVDMAKASIESQRLEWMLFLDSLDRPQVEALANALNICAAEGDGNYRTAAFYGMLMRELHIRNPITPDSIINGGGDTDKET